jgi:hypothetical protein
VALNPHKANTVKFSEEDFIIVVAEDKVLFLIGTPMKRI